jgi:hypothetical protein
MGIHYFIEEYHTALTRTLSDHVQVDTRVGRGDYGIYQEPLERVLQYIGGLSMNKDQIVNTSIDGDQVRRVLKRDDWRSAEQWYPRWEDNKRAKGAEEARKEAVLE